MGCGDARALKTGISRRSGASLEGFLDFEAPDYSPEATETFLRLLDDEDYINEIRAYSVFDGGALMGMLATRWGREPYHHFSWTANITGAASERRCSRWPPGIIPAKK